MFYCIFISSSGVTKRKFKVKHYLLICFNLFWSPGDTFQEEEEHQLPSQPTSTRGVCADRLCTLHTDRRLATSKWDFELNNFMFWVEVANFLNQCRRFLIHLDTIYYRSLHPTDQKSAPRNNVWNSPNTFGCFHHCFRWAWWQKWNKVEWHYSGTRAPSPPSGPRAPDQCLARKVEERLGWRW